MAMTRADFRIWGRSMMKAFSAMSRNPEKAAQFYLRAAAMGNSAAMFNATR